MWCCRWRATGSIGSKGSPKGDKGDRGGKGKAERKGDKGKAKPVEKVEMDVARVKVQKSSTKSSTKSPPQHHHPSGSARPIFGQPSGSLRQPETADFGSKVHIHVHVNGQEMPRCPTPGDPLRNCSRGATGGTASAECEDSPHGGAKEAREEEEEEKSEKPKQL